MALRRLSWGRNLACRYPVAGLASRSLRGLFRSVSDEQRRLCMPGLPLLHKPMSERSPIATASVDGLVVDRKAPRPFRSSVSCAAGCSCGRRHRLDAVRRSSSSSTRSALFFFRPAGSGQRTRLPADSIRTWVSEGQLAENLCVLHRRKLTGAWVRRYYSAVLKVEDQDAYQTRCRQLEDARWLDRERDTLECS